VPEGEPGSVPEYSIGAGGELLRRLFRRRNTRPRTNAAITATPPTEPPAMAPMLALDLDDDAAVVAEVVGPVEVALVLVVEVPLVLEELLLVSVASELLLVSVVSELLLLLLVVAVLVLEAMDSPRYVRSTETQKLDRPQP